VSHLAEPVGDHHDLLGLDCDDEELKVATPLTLEPATGQVTRTYVVVDEDNDVVGVPRSPLEVTAVALRVRFPPCCLQPWLSLGGCAAARRSPATRTGVIES
jgi:hypothetical protein